MSLGVPLKAFRGGAERNVRSGLGLRAGLGFVPGRVMLLLPSGRLEVAKQTTFADL